MSIQDPMSQRVKKNVPDGTIRLVSRSIRLIISIRLALVSISGVDSPNI